MTAARSPASVTTCSSEMDTCHFLLGRLTARRQKGRAGEPGTSIRRNTDSSGSFGDGTGSAEPTEDAEEATMLALLVAALVPTVVMTAALVLERLERCVLRHGSLDGAHVDRSGDAVGG